MASEDWIPLDGGLNNKGIFPPEYVGAIPGYCEKVLDYLLQRNIQVICNTVY